MLVIGKNSSRQTVYQFDSSCLNSIVGSIKFSYDKQWCADASVSLHYAYTEDIEEAVILELYHPVHGLVWGGSITETPFTSYGNTLKARGFQDWFDLTPTRTGPELILAGDPYPTLTLRNLVDRALGCSFEQKGFTNSQGWSHSWNNPLSWDIDNIPIHTDLNKTMQSLFRGVLVRKVMDGVFDRLDQSWQYGVAPSGDIFVEKVTETPIYNIDLGKAGSSIKIKKNQKEVNNSYFFSTTWEDTGDPYKPIVYYAKKEDATSVGKYYNRFTTGHRSGLGSQSAVSSELNKQYESTEVLEAEVSLSVKDIPALAMIRPSFWISFTDELESFKFKVLKSEYNCIGDDLFVKLTIGTTDDSLLTSLIDYNRPKDLSY